MIRVFETSKSSSEQTYLIVAPTWFTRIFRNGAMETKAWDEGFSSEVRTTYVSGDAGGAKLIAEYT